MTFDIPTLLSEAITTMSRSRKVANGISLLLAALLAGGGMVARAGAQFLDNRFAHADAFAEFQHQVTERDSAQARFEREIIIKVDSANLRLTQVLCGPSISRGCR